MKRRCVLPQKESAHSALSFWGRIENLYVPARKTGGQKLKAIARAGGIATGFRSWGIKAVCGVCRGNSVSTADAISAHKSVS